MLNLLDDTPVIPGDTRPPFEHGNQARQILNDAEEDLRDWRFEADDVPISNHMLDPNLMPTGGSGGIADASYEEEETLQTIPRTNETQSRSQGGTYLPHGTTLVGDEGGSSGARNEPSGGSSGKPRATFVENVDTPNVTMERAEVV